LFRPEWFDGRTIDPRELPEGLRLCRYWDLAATEASRGSDPDYTAGVLLGTSHDGLLCVADVRRERASPREVERLIERIAVRDRTWAKDRGFSPPSIHMEQEPGSSGKTGSTTTVGRSCTGSRSKGCARPGPRRRASAPVAARAEAHDIRICRGPWNSALIDELTGFPIGPHDDQLDAFAGAYQALAQRGSRWTPSPQNLTQPSYWPSAAYALNGWRF